mmetsp:Transcript_718/g.1506  ORF Transcript_718/g.1506 Transcript_718/m.1506 type:complete len:476 (-) Transcript_718:52-1479(-)|eukprot:CAMPEP_0178381738 /NCGR_PEP_ID=MMETSP0689_2-20121128/6141_1 /TAXON_ID=160604 /ORGANISM="Amphidinium massartii, Strain CS-259" /LENGTH=475 /DNA_ID=CAMNT_0020001937 /DNA_START=18 /DNA_END=1445 /DNA_ORIENTATION=-
MAEMDAQDAVPGANLTAAGSIAFEEKLFHALTRHARWTAGDQSLAREGPGREKSHAGHKGFAHPLPDRSTAATAWDWQAIGRAMGPTWSAESAMEATLGTGSGGLLPALTKRAGTTQTLASPEVLARLGIFVVKDFMTEEEEQAGLRALLGSDDSPPEVTWMPRETGGLHSYLGPSYIPNSGYKVDRKIPYTPIPDSLQVLQRRAEAVVCFAMDEQPHVKMPEAMEEAAARVRSALAAYGMTPATRAGHHGRFNQAFIQRYRRTDHVEDEVTRESLGMHFDARSENAEVVAGLSFGSEPGAIFFSRSGPRKGRPFPVSRARALQEAGEGVLLMLPRRSMYLFFGLARYYFKHGVPWCGPEDKSKPYDRCTVTFRSSVPEQFPARSEIRKQQRSRSPKRQRRLADFLVSPATAAANAPRDQVVVPLAPRACSWGAFQKPLQPAPVLGSHGMEAAPVIVDLALSSGSDVDDAEAAAV